MTSRGELRLNLDTGEILSDVLPACGRSESRAPPCQSAAPGHVTRTGSMGAGS